MSDYFDGTYSIAENAAPDNQHRLITQALIDTDPALQRLWHTSAEFKYSIENLARMLPLMVRGLAEGAQEQEKKLAQMRRLTEQSRRPPMLINPITGERTPLPASAWEP